MECIIIRLEAPLMSWGGDLVANNASPNRDFPTLSLMVGTIANALGLERHDHRPHQELQDAIIMASRIDRNPTLPHLVDYQTAKLEFDDQAWTTSGQPMGRKGGKDKFDNSNISHRMYIQDAAATVALALTPDKSPFTAAEVAKALQQPLRPLFIGRRPCIPTEELYADTINAPSPLAALLGTPLFWSDPKQPNVRMQWTPEQESTALPVTVTKRTATRDTRDWRSRIHGGNRPTVEGTTPTTTFPNDDRQTNPYLNNPTNEEEATQ